MLTFGLGPLASFPATEAGRVARLLEELGFDQIWIPDERFFRDVAVSLTAAAMSTTRLRIGTAVTDPFVRHPALTAQWTASLDELSGGRMVVGIGAGVAGFHAMGIQRGRPVPAIREMVELMRRMWTGEPVEYEAETVRFVDSRMDFKPVRSRIPCYIAGRGPKVLELAGQIGDGVMIGSLASPAGLGYALGRVDAGLRAVGRTRDDLDVSIWLHTAVAEDGAVARAAVRRVVTGVLISSLNVLDDLGIPVPQHIKDGLKGVRYGHSGPEMERAQALITEDLIPHFAAAGTPDEVTGRIRLLEEAGVQHIAVKPWLAQGQTLDDFARMFATQVMTKLK